MLKYIKEHASSIEGISIYPIFSLLVFFIFFVVLLYYVKKMDKKKIEEISNLPLDSDTRDNDLFTTNNLKQA
ncbi:MAG: cbb3-type cytochrome c oxidase subunit 3 [Bacteroidetes bacterium]|nr:MAG: cbb3-type cytochrome c oxidase subunit 3 [Bacteroidota bacterium]